MIIFNNYFVTLLSQQLTGEEPPCGNTVNKLLLLLLLLLLLDVIIIRCVYGKDHMSALRITSESDLLAVMKKFLAVTSSHNINITLV